MRLSDGERLIVVMLAEVMEALGATKELDPSLIKRLAWQKDDWAIETAYPNLFSSHEVSDAVVQETVDILMMWSFIEHSISELEGKEAEEAAHFKRTKFTGFDGNNDAHYGVAHTLINDLDRFTEFKKHPLNSHSSATIARYREMLVRFNKEMEGTFGDPFTFEQLRELCN